MTTSAIVGDTVTVSATVADTREGYAHLMVVPNHLGFGFWVRHDDVDDTLTGFRGTVTQVDGGQVTVRAYSPTDEYELTVPATDVVINPHAENLKAGHTYREFGTFSSGWLYDGEAFYPIETFPHGAVDRDQLPPRLEDLGHLRDH